MKKPQTLKKKMPVMAFFVFCLIAFGALPARAQLLDPATQTKFVNPLPIPAEIDATKGITLQMEMNQTTQWLGLTHPTTGVPLMTTVWGYGPLGGPVSFPGPTLIATKNVPVKVTWHNNLPSGHLLPVDVSLHMAHPHGVSAADFYAAGNIPTVVHLHGGKTESASDGLPEAWFTQGFGTVGPYFVKQQYTYHNSQEAATLWYHDHALGITRLNVYAGLAGFYQLEDKRERNLVKNNVLPKGAHDIEIVIQDRMFRSNGELFLPSESGDPWFGDAEGEPLDLPFAPSVVAEFFGDFIVVNGVSWPFLEVEPRKYRFRLLNGSDSRFYVLELGPKGSQKEFIQIATDNGLLPTAVGPLTQLVLAPGERAEIVVDFSSMINQSITLFNYGPDSPFKGSNINAVPSPHTGEIMQFRVTKRLKVNRGNPIPTVMAGTTLRPALEDLGTPDETRKLALFEGEDADGRLQPLLGIVNGDAAKSATTVNGSLAWFEDITENPALGSVEEWAVYNATEDAHPIHLHLVSFQIVDRRPFTATVNTQGQIQHDGRTGIGGYIVESSISEGAPQLPALNERGWKDTFIVPPGFVGRVKARFERPGRYVWHCHILSHEDHEMMRPFHVGPMPVAGLKSESADDVFIDNTVDFRIFPNPMTDEGFIELRLEQESNINIRIFDLDGRLLQSDNLGLLGEGSYTMSFPVDQIDNGLYILELRAGTQLMRERMLISR
jgi:spore coat protein A